MMEIRIGLLRTEHDLTVAETHYLHAQYHPPRKPTLRKETINDAPETLLMLALRRSFGTTQNNNDASTKKKRTVP